MIHWLPEPLATWNARLPQPMKFAAVGAFNAGLDVALFTGLVYLFAVGPVTANIVSYSLAIASSFFLNRFWTFADHEQPVTLRQFLLFAGLNTIGLAISTAVIWMMVPLIGPLPAKILSLLATYVWNYGTSRFVVFRPVAPVREHSA